MTTSPPPPPDFPIHHLDIPYTSPATALQTYSIWLPRPLSDSDPTSTVWIVYIHGGAWRDPAQTSQCILPALRHLSPSNPAKTTPNSPALRNIAGIASLNYRLSPYPSHPTDPSDGADQARNVRHPAHVRDVQTALKFFKKRYGLGEKSKWVGIGHSCGATLLAQLVAGIGLASPIDAISTDDTSFSTAVRGERVEEEQETRMSGPSALVLLDGIYDIPLFLTNHTPSHGCPEAIAQIYRDIVEGAFGAEEADWSRASPTSGSYDEKQVGPELGHVVICHSPEDELVEKEQRDVMVQRLMACGWVATGKGRAAGAAGMRIVEIRDLEGGHDDIWEDGKRIAELIEEVSHSICRGP